MQTLEIQKYGGLANTNAESFKRSASIISQSRQPRQSLLVVMSAMYGVTDQLYAVTHNAVKKAIEKNGYQNSHPRTSRSTSTFSTNETDLDYAIREGLFKKVFKANAERHHMLTDETVDPKLAGSLRLHEMIDKRTTEANGHVASMVDLESVNKRWLDWILGMLGEEFASPIMTAHLLSCGIRAVNYNASEIIVTDGTFGNANPQIENTRNRFCDSGLTSDLQKGVVGVIGGFIGSPDGGRKITVLGKGGSDRTATACGEAMKPLFNDVTVVLYKADPELDAVMSGDPKLIKNPHAVNYLHYLEACYLASVGGKILHPKATDHALEGDFSIWVRNTLKTELPGTLISGEVRTDDPAIKAVSVVRDGIGAKIKGRGMDKPGILGRSATALASIGADIAFISQPSRIELYFGYQYTGREKEDELEAKLREESRKAQEVLEKALESDLATKDVASVSTGPASMLGIIGRGASRLFNPNDVFTRMNKENFKILTSSENYRIATGEYGVTLLCDSREEEFIKALAQSVHDSVFPL